MNIFEDLVEELKEENLLEETVIETQRESLKTADSESVADILSEFKDVLGDEAQFSKNETPNGEADALPEPVFAAAIEENIETPVVAAAISEPTTEFDIPLATAPINEAEFYSKRATEEVTGLQLVEHVFSGAEREQMKILPKPYDDLECKKALHTFLQVSQSPNSPEHAKAEFHLMQETESWYSALSHRDRHISVTHLRRYCETTRPALSPTALIALARFYRNSPFSEQVRSKYDLVMTRLFTKDLPDDRRELAMSREELMKHLETLYSQWASIPLYTANDDDSEILIITLKFEDFMTEAASATNFDELVKNDFFNRLRNFKESTHENFFAPLVTATAIECNVRIGNRYVELIRAEKEKVEQAILEDKYGFLHDQAISESSSKTLQLVQLLRQKTAAPEPVVVEEKILIKSETQPKADKKAGKNAGRVKKQSPFRVNKWLLAATILIVVVNVGLYFWMTYANEPEINNQKVERVNLENSSLREYIKEARIANSTFFGVVQPNWTGLEQAKKEEILKKLYNLSGDKGFSKVHLFDKDGKTAGYADGTTIQAN